MTSCVNTGKNYFLFNRCDVIRALRMLPVLRHTSEASLTQLPHRTSAKSTTSRPTLISLFWLSHLVKYKISVILSHDSQFPWRTCHRKTLVFAQFIERKQSWYEGRSNDTFQIPSSQRVTFETAILFLPVSWLLSYRNKLKNFTQYWPRFITREGRISVL